MDTYYMYNGFPFLFKREPQSHVYFLSSTIVSCLVEILIFSKIGSSSSIIFFNSFNFIS